MTVGSALTWRCRIGALALLALLGACSTTPQKPKPAELPPNPNLISVQQAWSTKIGAVGFPLDVRVSGETVVVAASDGTVGVIDARTGSDVWRVSIGAPLNAGVGHDGRLTAVITRNNELVTLASNGRELWRQRLAAQSLTAPLVAGERVFVLGGDRAVTAFDAQSGRRLWSQQRPGEALVLRQAGALLAVGDTLVVGLSGKLVGMNPLNGSVRWEAPIASPRGTNDVERLVDLVAHVSRLGDVVCARAFQAAVGCVNTARGSLVWTKTASGAQGLDGDERSVYGAEADGMVQAWGYGNGEPVWIQDKLRYRKLSTPVVLGRSVVVGDESGWVHFLSRENGSFLTRVATDGSGLAAAPVLAGNTLVLVTQNGNIFGFRPE